ncbi:uncharacterized protein LOC104366909 [Tyto alba]|uniref:uncharacterized protein LOC104366909 n=1 Tax=Tyto alba TaxID=56313 RepID=UPI001C66FEE6|nr:uncharacterized protein LOC104366909 [Tyto alba]
MLIVVMTVSFGVFCTGLDNALICVVRNSFSREHPSAGNTVTPEQEADQEHVLTGNASSNASTNSYLPKLEGFMRRELGISQFMTRGHADVPERIKNRPTSSEKVLEKLSKILQTDSLIEIQRWFARASKKEKDFVSSLISSELHDKGMLNFKESTAETMNSLSLPKLPPPLLRCPEGEMNQSR